MAGSAENDFAIRSKEAETVVSQEFAKFVGYHGDVNDSKAILEYMRAQPINKLELGMTGMHEKKVIFPRTNKIPFSEIHPVSIWLPTVCSQLGWRFFPCSNI